MGWFRGVLEIISYLIGCVGFLMVASAMRASMHERKRDFAILRSLGAGRVIVMNVVLAHSLIISIIGALGAILFMKGIGLITQKIIHHETGVLMELINLEAADLLALSSILGIGVLGGLWSAIHAYRTDLAQNLQPSS